MGGKMIVIEHAKFMELFVPAPEREVEPTERLSSLDFSKIAVTPESAMYGPLMDALNQDWLLPHDHAVATPHKADPTSSSRKKIDGGIYPRQHAPTNSEETRWGYIELSIECKTMSGAQQDPFDEDKDDPEPISGLRRSILGQIMTYSVLVFDDQHRTHHYTLLILGDTARIIRWDRSGVVATHKFNYVQNPLMLAQFIWRFARMSPAERGHDITAVRVLPGSADYKLMDEYASKIPKATPGIPPVEDHVHRLFKKSLVNASRWKLRVDDADKGPQYFLVGNADFKAPGLAGRGTRTYVALDVTHRTRRSFAYLKDAWRVAHLNIDQEGDILKVLNSDDNGGPVNYVPTLRCHGDVEAQVTVSQDVWEMKYGGKGLVCPLKTHRHYRLVVNEVGLPLSEFQHTSELLALFTCVIKAHGQAYNGKGLIHRDISAGNILIYPTLRPHPVTGKMQATRVALLADWELAKRVNEDDEGPRQPDRTGTWQFLSASALSRPSKRIIVQDDMESLFHLLLYQAIRYLPHNCSDVGRFIDQYFDGYEQDRGVYYGGEKKMRSMRDGILSNQLLEPLEFYLSEPTPPPEPILLQPMTEVSKAPENAEATSHATAGGGSLTQSGIPSQADPGSPSTKSALPEPTLAEDPPLHPINGLFNDILQLIKAHYSLYVPRTVKSRSSAKVASTQDAEEEESHDDPLLMVDFVAHVKTAPTSKGIPAARPSPSTMSPANLADLEADAAKLASHDAMVDLFVGYYVESKKWSKKDRVPDKLPPKYRRRNERRIAASIKRSADSTFETSDRPPKRNCTVGGR
ncbi:hypothetical protein GY45DRAFT_376123 [Cubamyces sp. BRFM 1775]|nr:hypothetical protein GY45DRAFT_376123 [Cubamyces sp. BRFM 1775]